MAPETIHRAVYCDQVLSIKHTHLKNNILLRRKQQSHSLPQPDTHDALEILLLPEVAPVPLTAAERIAATAKWHAINRQWTTKYNHLFEIYKNAASVLGERARGAYRIIFDQLQNLVVRLMKTFDALQNLQHENKILKLTHNQINRALRHCLETTAILAEQTAKIHVQIKDCELERVEILNKMLQTFIECVRPFNNLNNIVGNVDVFRDRQVLMFDQTLLCNQRAIAAFFHQIELSLVRFKMPAHIVSRIIICEWKKTKFRTMVEAFLSSVAKHKTEFSAQFGQRLSTLSEAYKTDVLDVCHEMLKELCDLVVKPQESPSYDAVIDWWRKAFSVTNTRARSLVFEAFLTPLRGDTDQQLSASELSLISLKYTIVHEQKIYSAEELYSVPQNRLMFKKCVQSIARQRSFVETITDNLEVALTGVLHRNMLRMRAAFAFAYAAVTTWQSYMLALRVAHQSLQLHLQLVRNEFVSKYHVVMLALDLALDRLLHARSMEGLHKRKQNAIKAAENTTSLRRILFKERLSNLMDFYPRIVERQSRIYLERLCRIFQLCMPWWWRVRRIITKPASNPTVDQDTFSDQAGQEPSAVPHKEEQNLNEELLDFLTFLRQQNLIDNNDTELFTRTAGGLYHNIGQMLAESELLADWTKNESQSNLEKAEDPLAPPEVSPKNNFLLDMINLLRQHHSICAPLFSGQQAKMADVLNAQRSSTIVDSDSATKLTVIDEERWHVGSVQDLSATHDEEENLDDFLMDIDRLFSYDTNRDGGRSRKTHLAQHKLVNLRDFSATRNRVEQDDLSESDQSLNGAARGNRHQSLHPSSAKENGDRRGRWAAHATRSFESLEIILRSAAPNVLRLRKRYGIMLDFATIISLRDQSKRKMLLTEGASETSSNANASRSTSRTRGNRSKQRITTAVRQQSPPDLRRTNRDGGTSNKNSVLIKNFHALMNQDRAMLNWIKHQHSRGGSDDLAEEVEEEAGNDKKDGRSVTRLTSAAKSKKSLKNSGANRRELPLESSDDEIKALSHFPWATHWREEFNNGSKVEQSLTGEAFHTLLKALKIPENVDIFVELGRESQENNQQAIPKSGLFDKHSRAYYASLAVTSVDVLEKCSVILSDNTGSQNTDTIFLPNERHLHRARHFERWRKLHGGGRYDPADNVLVKQILFLVLSAAPSRNILSTTNAVAEHFLIDNRNVEQFQHKISESFLQHFVTDWWPNTVKQTTSLFVSTWKTHLYHQMVHFNGCYWLKVQNRLIDYIFDNRKHNVEQHDILRRLHAEKVRQFSSSATQNVHKTIAELHNRINRLRISVTQGNIYQRATVTCEQQSSLNDLLEYTRGRIVWSRAYVNQKLVELARSVRLNVTLKVTSLNCQVLKCLRTFLNSNGDFTAKEAVDISRFLTRSDEKVHACETSLQKDISTAGERFTHSLAQVGRMCSEQFQQFQQDLQMTLFSRRSLRRMQYSVRLEAERLRKAFERIESTRISCEEQIRKLAEISVDPLKSAEIDSGKTSSTGILGTDCLIARLKIICKQMQYVAEFTECKQKRKEENSRPQTLQKMAVQQETATNNRPLSATVASTTKTASEFSVVQQQNRPLSAKVDGRRQSADVAKLSESFTSASKARVGMAFIAQLSMLAIASKQRQNASKRPSRESRRSTLTLKNNHELPPASLDGSHRLQIKQSQMQLRSKAVESAFKNVRCLLLGLSSVEDKTTALDEKVHRVSSQPNIVQKIASTAESHSHWLNLSVKTSHNKRLLESHKRSASQFTKRSDFKHQLTTLAEENEGRNSLRPGQQPNRRQNSRNKNSLEAEDPQQQLELEMLNNKNVEASNRLASIVANDDPLRNVPKRITAPQSDLYDISSRVEQVLHPPSGASQPTQRVRNAKRNITSSSVIEKYYVLGSDDSQNDDEETTENTDLESKKSKKVLSSVELRPGTASKAPSVSVLRRNLIQEQHQSNLKITVPSRRRCVSSSESDSEDPSLRQQQTRCSTMPDILNTSDDDALPLVLPHKITFPKLEPDLFHETQGRQRPESSPAATRQKQTVSCYRDVVIQLLKHKYNRLLRSFCKFYESKSLKRQPILRTNDLAPTFEACATALMITMHSYLKQSNQYHEDCVNLLVDEAKHCELLLSRAFRSVVDCMKITFAAHSEARTDLMMTELRKHARDVLVARRHRRQQLTTSLGHPSNQHLLERIVAEELQEAMSIRQLIQQQTVRIWQTKVTLTQLFFDKLQETAQILLEFCASTLVCADEIAAYWVSQIAEQHGFWKYLEESIDGSQMHPTALLEELHTRRIMSFPRVTLCAPSLRSLPLSGESSESPMLSRRTVMDPAVSALNTAVFPRRGIQYTEERDIKFEDEQERVKFVVKTKEFEKIFEADDEQVALYSQADGCGDNSLYNFVCFRGYRTQTQTNLSHVSAFLAVQSAIQNEKSALAECARKLRDERRILLDAALQEELLWEDDLIKINDIFKVAEIYQNG